MRSWPHMDPVVTEPVGGARGSEEEIAASCVLALSHVVRSAAVHGGVGNKTRESCVELVHETFRGTHEGQPFLSSVDLKPSYGSVHSSDGGSRRVLVDEPAVPQIGRQMRWMSPGRRDAVWSTGGIAQHSAQGEGKRSERAVGMRKRARRRSRTDPLHRACRLAPDDVPHDAHTARHV
ncbi:hypothetical protein HD554DRAFT_1846047 [Boletus coccyginus]|nr:hypothetical protein HD554DRAFT_1846047 [Boletus coccyginus]